MPDNIVLTYINSVAIESFISNHPIDWRDVELARLGKPGDIMTPEPAMSVFYSFFLERGGQLFTQQQFVHYCLFRWQKWAQGLSRLQLRGIAARLGCNFYVAGIDTLHVWAMLVELGICKRCTIDVFSDVYEKVDIMVETITGINLKLALAFGSAAGRSSYDYKSQYRHTSGDAVVLWLPPDRPKTPGNKRWYRVDDLIPILETCFVGEHGV